MRHLSQAFSVFDKDLNLVIWNPQFAKLLGFPDDLLYEGAPLASFFRHNAERGEYGEGDLDALVDERIELARQNQAHHFQRVTKDGIVLDVVGNPLPSGGFVTTYSDITERVDLEKELSRAKADRTGVAVQSYRILRRQFVIRLGGYNWTLRWCSGHPRFIAFTVCPLTSL